MSSLVSPYLFVSLEEDLDVNLAADNERGSPAAGAHFEVAASDAR